MINQNQPLLDASSSALPRGGSDLSRRRFLAAASLAATAFCLAPRRLFADDDGVVPTMRKAAGAATITVQPLRGNISVLLGAGGNIAVLTGPDGKLLVDAGIATARPRLTQALASIDSVPIKHLINTHWHFDHTDGNEWLNSAGAIILAHEKTRKRLSALTRVDGWNFNFPPASAGALPTEVFESEHSLEFNGTNLLLKYYGRAHTDCDISVEFTDADVLHVADTWWNGVYPFIDYSTGGSINGTIAATEANLARTTDQTIIIPGHGPVGDKAQLTEYRDMLVTVRDRVSTLKKQGRSLAEVVAAKPSAAYDEKWGQYLTKPNVFTGLVYAGV